MWPASTCRPRAYRHVRPLLLVEEFLSRPGESESPPDVKIYVFHGRATHVFFGRRGRARALYGPDWKLLGYDRWQRFEAAEHIAAGIDHLRVDMYEVGGEVVFGETTVYPLSGHFTWIPHDVEVDRDPPLEIDRQVGDLWTLPKVGRLTALKRGLIR